MEILSKAFGEYGTNCYIIKGTSGDLVIDPGENAAPWVFENTNKILAVLNTHGHFDHTYDDKILQNSGIKIYIHEKDEFFCTKDPFEKLNDVFSPDFLLSGDEILTFGNFNVKFAHFAGHTPGCSMIFVSNGKINKNAETLDEMFSPVDTKIFSGDVIFRGSVGRSDFPFSNQEDMKISLQNILKIKQNFEIYPGHGAPTNLENERRVIEYFLKYF